MNPSFRARWLVGTALAVSLALALGSGIGITLWAEARLGLGGAIALGATVGVMTTYVVVWVVWQGWLRLVHGAPFRPGDRVRVLSGPQTGAEGVVRETIAERQQLRLEWLDVVDPQKGKGYGVVGWHEVKRVR